jgi:hypothetical protein
MQCLIVEVIHIVQSAEEPILVTEDATTQYIVSFLCRARRIQSPIRSK